jgi:hypothetical protein
MQKCLLAEGDNSYDIDVDDVLNRIAPIIGAGREGVAAANATAETRARDIYVQAIRQRRPLFAEAEIASPLRMAHFLAQSRRNRSAKAPVTGIAHCGQIPHLCLANRGRVAGRSIFGPT